MFIKNIDSSVIKSVAYKNKTLTIRLTTGRAYAYFDVPRKTFNSLLSADSAGSYYNNNIRNNYECEEIEETV